MKIEIKRGDMFFANLDPVIGSEQGGTRPVLIIQNDVGNKYSPTTIVVATITSKASGGYQLYICLTRTSGMAADYATMDEATNGAAMILDKPWAPAVIVARPR